MASLRSARRPQAETTLHQDLQTDAIALSAALWPGARVVRWSYRVYDIGGILLGSSFFRGILLVIWGCILGVPYFGKPPCMVQRRCPPPTPAPTPWYPPPPMAPLWGGVVGVWVEG